MAKGIFSQTSAVISTATTTTLATPATAPGESVYLMYVGVDVTVVGTGSSAKVQGSGGAVIAGVFPTTVLGHLSDYYTTSMRDYPGLKLPEGSTLDVVTVGTATLTVTAIYQIK